MPHYPNDFINRPFHFSFTICHSPNQQQHTGTLHHTTPHQFHHPFFPRKAAFLWKSSNGLWDCNSLTHLLTLTWLQWVTIRNFQKVRKNSSFNKKLKKKSRNIDTHVRFMKFSQNEEWTQRGAHVPLKRIESDWIDSVIMFGRMRLPKSEMFHEIIVQLSVSISIECLCECGKMRFSI